jgi:MFS family permease
MSTTADEPRTIRTNVPARLDRLPWSRFHWRIVIGLGTVWILDGLQVTIVGAIAPRMTEAGSGIDLSTADIGLAGALYVAGACLGALFFGHLTDRYGRKKLFMLTLGLYILASVATAFAFAPWYFFLFRFLTGFGIGGEYSAINTAIDELIPARNRGQVDLAINGSFWVGAGIGAVAALLFLDQGIFATDLGWRLAFAIGAVLGVGILVVRRNVPESPRWLFIHGREQEAERIVDQIEAEVRAEVGEELPEPEGEIVVTQRDAIPFREIASVTAKRYPQRAILGLSLFIGQAFLYNAVTFDLGTILHQFFDVGSSQIPYFMVVFAASNFVGPLLLGRLFDTVGRIPMIAGTYLGSAAVVVALGVLLRSGGLTTWEFMALVLGAFFLASAGASSAYLTVSEIFPMETRALAIALFYAVGTGHRRRLRTAALRAVHPQRQPRAGRDRLLHRRRRDGASAGSPSCSSASAPKGQSLEDIATPLSAEQAERIGNRAERERQGLRRFRPGPGPGRRSPRRGCWAPRVVSARPWRGPTRRSIARSSSSRRSSRSRAPSDGSSSRSRSMGARGARDASATRCARRCARAARARWPTTPTGRRAAEAPAHGASTCAERPGRPWWEVGVARQLSRRAGQARPHRAAGHRTAAGRGARALRLSPPAPRARAGTRPCGPSPPIALVILGWQIARDVGRSLGSAAPAPPRHGDGRHRGLPHPARDHARRRRRRPARGEARPRTLALGGAFTAVVVGLAAQQTLGNLIAGTVLVSARPFRVGERVRLQGGPLAGTVEGVVSSLGLLYTILARGEDAIMVPTPSSSTWPSCRCASRPRSSCARACAQA